MDQGELTGGAESLENVSKASEDHRRLLRSKTKPGIQEGVETNVVTTEVAASGDVLPHDHDVCTDAVAEPVPPSCWGIRFKNRPQVVWQRLQDHQ